MAGKSLTELPQTNEIKEDDLLLISRSHDTGNAALSRAVKAGAIEEFIGHSYVKLVDDEDVSGVKNFADGIKIGSKYQIKEKSGELSVMNNGLVHIKSEDGKVYIGSNTTVGDPLVKAYAPVPSSVSNEIATTRWTDKNYAKKDHTHDYTDLTGDSGFAKIGVMAGSYTADEGKYIDGITINADSTVSISQKQFKEPDLLTLDTVVDALYPVGAIYIGLTDICPISYLKGQWQKISSGKVLQTSGNGHITGSYVEEGLPGISSNATISGTTSTDGGHGHAYDIGVGNCTCGSNGNNLPRSTHVGSAGATGHTASGGSHNHTFSANVKLNVNSSVYGKSEHVQPPAFVVNVWKRIA